MESQLTITKGEMLNKSWLKIKNSLFVFKKEGSYQSGKNVQQNQGFPAQILFKASLLWSEVKQELECIRFTGEPDQELAECPICGSPINFECSVYLDDCCSTCKFKKLLTQYPLKKDFSILKEN